MVITPLDFDRPGKQQGFLQVPYSHNLGGWANVFVPTTIVAHGTGPTVLVLGGNHGAEYQGQIAIMKLARELTPAQVTGRLILIPSLNFPAALLGTRVVSHGPPGSSLKLTLPEDSASRWEHRLRTLGAPG